MSKDFFLKIYNNNLLINWLSNFSYNFLIQIIQFLFPLLIIPLLIKRLGIDYYGIIALILGVTNFSKIISDFSYNTLGPKKIVELRKEPYQLCNYLSEAVSFKIILGVIASLLTIIILNFYDLPNAKLKIVIFSLIYVISRALNTYWIFLGIENLKSYFKILLLSRIVIFSLIILFVKNEINYPLVILFMGIGDLFVFILSITFLNIKLQLKISLKIPNIKKELIDGYQMFITNVSIASIFNSNIIILGFIVNNELLGMYSIVEKIINLMKHSAGVVFQGVLSKMVLLHKEKYSKFKEAFNLYILIQVGIMIIGSLIVFFWGKYILAFFTSEKIEEAYVYLKVLCFLPIIHATSYPLFLYLILKEERYKYSMAYFLGLLIHLLSFFIFNSYSLNIYSAIFASYCSELTISLLLFIHNYQYLTLKSQ